MPRKNSFSLSPFSSSQCSIAFTSFVPAPFADHRVALLGRQEPSVAEHPIDQRREATGQQRRGNSAGNPALGIPRERQNRLADELLGGRVVQKVLR